jgi:hypothetical protein
MRVFAPAGPTGTAVSYSLATPSSGAPPSTATRYTLATAPVPLPLPLPQSQSQSQSQTGGRDAAASSTTPHGSNGMFYSQLIAHQHAALQFPGAGLTTAPGARSSSAGRTRGGAGGIVPDGISASMSLSMASPTRLAGGPGSPGRLTRSQMLPGVPAEVQAASRPSRPPRRSSYTGTGTGASTSTAADSQAPSFARGRFRDNAGAEDGGTGAPATGRGGGGGGGGGGRDDDDDDRRERGRAGGRSSQDSRARRGRIVLDGREFHPRNRTGSSSRRRDSDITEDTTDAEGKRGSEDQSSRNPHPHAHSRRRDGYEDDYADGRGLREAEDASASPPSYAQAPSRQRRAETHARAADFVASYRGSGDSRSPGGGGPALVARYDERGPYVREDDRRDPPRHGGAAASSSYSERSEDTYDDRELEAVRGRGRGRGGEREREREVRSGGQPAYYGANERARDPRGGRSGRTMDDDDLVEDDDEDTAANTQDDDVENDRAVDVDGEDEEDDSQYGARSRQRAQRPADVDRNNNQRLRFAAGSEAGSRAPSEGGASSAQYEDDYGGRRSAGGGPRGGAGGGKGRSSRDAVSHHAAVAAAKEGNAQLLGLQNRPSSWRLV